jgi:ABC-type antimicrobial peptide transport system permease subunit
MSSGFEVLAGILLVIGAAAPVVWWAWKRPLLRRAARRSARGHLKQGLTVALTACLATAVIAGALVVGDSMEALVEETASEALPGIDAFITTTYPVETGYFSSLFFYPDWQKRVDRQALLLTVPAATTCDSTGQRDGQVVLYGFNDGLYGFSSFFKDGDERTAPIGTGEVVINRNLADQLDARPGDTITLRVPNPDFWSDFLFLYGEEASVERSYRVAAVFDDDGLGRLDLEAKRTPTSAVFMSLDDAQDLMEVGDRVNTVVFQYKDRDIVGTDKEEKLIKSLRTKLDDLVGAEGANLRVEVSLGGWSVLTSDRIFLPSDLEPRLAEETWVWSSALTYFVDGIAHPSNNGVSYSTVTGLDFDADMQALGPWQWAAGSPQRVPAPGSMEALVNNWTAEQLGIQVGDDIFVIYTEVDERYNLRQRTVLFRVVGIVDLVGKAHDPSLLPPIPGVHDTVSCLDWEPPFPMDLTTIEEEDVEYWHAYKGTPKVWIDLGTARELWTNPDGDWTSARYYPYNETDRAARSLFDGAVNAGDAGIFIVPARAEAYDTADPLSIFEQMFMAFGGVLLLAGCLLMASAFSNLARSRQREHSTLRALGLDEKGMIQVMLMEGMVWGVIAGILGIMAGAGLGAGLVASLNTVWADAVQGASIPLRIDGGSLWLALGIGLMVTLGTLFLSARKAARAHIATALADRTGTGVDTSEPIPRNRAAALALVLLTVPALVGVALMPSSDIGGIVTFFIVGALASLGGVLIALPILRRLEQRVERGGPLAPWRMGLRSLNRRPGRSLSLIATFALVAFAVIGISWAGEMEIRYAGDLQEEMTGGYDVLAETWVQVGGDLKDDPAAPEGDWTVTPVKVVGHQGGTCSNLNARFPPRIMGMPPEFLSQVELGFRSSEVGDDRETWEFLGKPAQKGRIPVVVDYNTLVWVYGGAIGDVYQVEGDGGRTYKMEVVGVMENSIFGGSFLTSLDHVETVYPDSAAYTYFLFDSGSKSPEKLSRELEEAFGDLGLDARTTVAVVQENLGYELSFLHLFQAYLALGLVIGALGLGALAAREVQDRRREIGGMKALGWPKRMVWQTFLAEQVWFALTGVVIGIIGAAIAIVAISPGWLGSVTAIYFPAGTVAMLALAMVGAAGLGALVAARDAARVPAADAMRSSQ